MANQGKKPAGAAPAPSLVPNSIRSSGVQKRSRVSTFTITRSRALPVNSSRHWSGWLPYICARKSPRSGLRSTVSTSSANATALVADQEGNTPACTISTSWPWSCSSIARRCRASHSSMAARSGASRIAASVSLRCGLRTPCAVASRCRSWLPSKQRAALPSRIKRCSTPSESGPRLTRSPSRYRVSRLGEKSIRSSNRRSASSQPCTSPIR